MLLEADWVLPISGPPIAEGAVLVRDEVIDEVGPAAELRARHPGETVRAFPGSVLMPGLVNTHTHLDYSAFRDFAPPSGFGQWMRRLLLARQKLDSDDYAASASWGAHECVRSGVTCVGDTSFEGWTVARAAGSAGLRARIYLEVFGLDDAELPATMAGLEARLAALLEECLRTPAALEAGISPHAPYTASAGLYQELARLAARSQLPVATHVAESAAEVEFLDRGTGTIPDVYREAGLWKGGRFRPPHLSPVEYLWGAGILGPRTLAVHCVQVDDADIALLAESGAAVAHCPRSNLHLQCGSAPVAALIGAGVTVGLGTDSLSSNESLDMFAEMRAALAVSAARPPRGEPPRIADSALTPASVLRMATLEGARALGWDHLVGSLEKGKRADLVAVRLPVASSQPDGGLEASLAGIDPVVSLVSVATASDVGTVMVDGRVIFESRLPDGLPLLGSDPSLIVDVVPIHKAFAAVRAKLGLNDL
jgi:cytosine/adenosine deaminase-related metal-dependent hydrolase